MVVVYTKEEDEKIREMAVDLFNSGMHARGDDVESVIHEIKSAIQGENDALSPGVSIMDMIDPVRGPNRHERRRSKAGLRKKLRR